LRYALIAGQHHRPAEAGYFTGSEPSAKAEQDHDKCTIRVPLPGDMSQQSAHVSWLQDLCRLPFHQFIHFGRSAHTKLSALRSIAQLDKIDKLPFVFKENMAAKGG